MAKFQSVTVVVSMISAELHHDLEKGSQEPAAHFTGGVTEIQEGFAYLVVVMMYSWGFKSGFQVCCRNHSLLHYGMDQEYTL